MTTCMFCDAEIPAGVTHCPYCNAAQPIEAAAMQAQSDPAAVQQPYQQPYGQPQPPYQQPGQQPYQQPNYQQPGYQPGYQQTQPAYMAPGTPVVNDSGSIGWGILGFFFPIVGLILFLVWKNTKPNCAKVAGIGAIIGFVLGLVSQFMILAA